MDDREMIYQRLILRLRRRYMEEGRPWPGRPEIPAGGARRAADGKRPAGRDQRSK